MWGRKLTVEPCGWKIIDYADSKMGESSPFSPPELTGWENLYTDPTAEIGKVWTVTTATVSCAFRTVRPIGLLLKKAKVGKLDSFSCVPF
jgi:hypothetical protein